MSFITAAQGGLLETRESGVYDPEFNDSKAIVRAFRHILTTDQEEHGVNDYAIEEETVDDFQQDVDDVIDATAANAASSV
ncbi:hypothetical protein R3P38DRAFT_3215057 [Favolaschia claudopus]|uniref:Uncharacterized protein n=1 Tax=Favolaschia claudopus TaxID=2862362 RepID=A0AAW0A8H8_9AGAR